MWHDYFSDVLRESFLELKTKNPQYSARAFANKLGISAGTLTDILGKRKSWKLREERAKALLEAMPIHPTKKNQVLAKMDEAIEQPTQTISENPHEVLANWEFFPVLYAIELPEPFSLPANIAQRLAISETRVHEVIDGLIAHGYLMRDEDGNLVKPNAALKSSDGPPSSVIRKHHADNLELSQRALATVAPAERDFTSLTFAGNPAQLTYLREEIRRLLEKAPFIMDDGPKNSNVFRLSIQLFPVDFKVDSK